MDPISFDAVRVLANATDSLKLATLSMATLRQARSRGGDDADPAVNYADALHTAIQSGQASQMALSKAQVEIEAQESLRQQQLQRESDAQARALDRERRRRALEDAKSEAQANALETEAARENGGRDSGGEHGGKRGKARPRRGLETRRGRGSPGPGGGRAEPGRALHPQGGAQGQAAGQHAERHRVTRSGFSSPGSRIVPAPSRDRGRVCPEDRHKSHPAGAAGANSTNQPQKGRPA